MSNRGTASVWVLLLFISSATVFAFLSLSITGFVVGFIMHSPRSVTVEVVRHGAVASSAPRPAHSTAPAHEH